MLEARLASDLRAGKGVQQNDSVRRRAHCCQPSGFEFRCVNAHMQRSICDCRDEKRAHHHKKGEPQWEPRHRDSVSMLAFDPNMLWLQSWPVALNVKTLTSDVEIWPERKFITGAVEVECSRKISSGVAFIAR